MTLGLSETAKRPWIPILATHFSSGLTFFFFIRISICLGGAHASGKMPGLAGNACFTVRQPASWSLPTPLAADCWQDGHLAQDPLLEFCILFPLKSILFLSPHQVFLSILLRETSILLSSHLPFSIDAVFNAQRVTKQRQNLFKMFLLEAYIQGWC